MSQSFTKSFYSQLCTSYNALDSFYNENSKITIIQEDDTNNDNNIIGKNELVEKLLSVHYKKKVIKVLISSIQTQENNDDMVISVIGQFVYHDNTTQRFVHMFIVIKENKHPNDLRTEQEEEIFEYKIKNEILTILDEEVVYKNLSLKNKIGNYLNSIRILRQNERNKNKLITEFSSYGTIIAQESDQYDFLIEYENEEMVRNVAQDMGHIRNRGYKVEFCTDKN